MKIQSPESAATSAIEALLQFAVRNSLIEDIDIPYYRNLLLDAVQMDAPAAIDGGMAFDPSAPTATPILNVLCDVAAAKGIIEDLTYARDLFSARLMGLITPSPRDIREDFTTVLSQDGAVDATDRFYQLCCACDYIKVDAIAHNIRYFANTNAGELEITINLSKPEKDPR